MEDGADERIDFRAAKHLFEQAAASQNPGSSAVTVGTARRSAVGGPSSQTVSNRNSSGGANDAVDARTSAIETRDAVGPSPENEVRSSIDVPRPSDSAAANGHGSRTPEVAAGRLTSSTSMPILQAGQSIQTSGSGGIAAQSFVIRNKRGDTSDLRWLTTVSGSFVKPGFAEPPRTSMTTRRDVVDLQTGPVSSQRIVVPPTVNPALSDTSNDEEKSKQVNGLYQNDYQQFMVAKVFFD